MFWTYSKQLECSPYWELLKTEMSLAVGLEAQGKRLNFSSAFDSRVWKEHQKTIIQGVLFGHLNFNLLVILEIVLLTAIIN